MGWGQQRNDEAIGASKNALENLAKHEKQRTRQLPILRQTMEKVVEVERMLLTVRMATFWFSGETLEMV
jgi:hypothetical protein